MTKTQAQVEAAKALAQYGESDWRVVPYDCDGGYALAYPIMGHDLWFILEKWDVNMFEDMRIINIASDGYPIVRLDTEDAAT